MFIERSIFCEVYVLNRMHRHTNRLDSQPDDVGSQTDGLDNQTNCPHSHKNHVSIQINC